MANAAQRLFKVFFHGPIAHAGGCRCRGYKRHQGEQEMARRRRQRANGTHGL